MKGERVNPCPERKEKQTVLLSTSKYRKLRPANATLANSIRDKIAVNLTVKAGNNATLYIGYGVVFTIVGYTIRELKFNEIST